MKVTKPDYRPTFLLYLKRVHGPNAMRIKWLRKDAICAMPTLAVRPRVYKNAAMKAPTPTTLPARAPIVAAAPED
jgi:hypothetical protein